MDVTTTTVIEMVTTTLPQVVAQVSAVTSKVPTTLPAWFVGVIAFSVEIIMRVWPTLKPRSLFVLVGQVFGLIGEAFKRISGLLDIIVQNLKDPETK